MRKLKTRRFGYICWGFEDGKPYLYLSPNASAWSATYLKGSRFSEKAKLKAQRRKERFGHGYDYELFKSVIDKYE